MPARCDECGQFTTITYDVWGTIQSSGIDHEACAECLRRNPRPVFGIAPSFLRDRLSHECEHCAHDQCHGFFDEGRRSLYSGYDTYGCHCACHTGSEPCAQHQAHGEVS